MTHVVVKVSSSLVQVLTHHSKVIINYGAEIQLEVGIQLLLLSIFL